MFDRYVDEDMGALELINEAHLDIQQLIGYLQNRKDITRLRLDSCNIGDEDVKALAESGLTNLTWLSLSGNKITDEGAKVLANGNLRNLAYLNLNDNKVGDKSKQAFAEALNARKLPKLEKLFFSHPLIDPYRYYTEELSDALKRNIDHAEKASKSKLPVIIACAGLLLGLSIAYFAGAIALTPILAIAVCLAAAAVGALVGYAVGKFCNKVIEEKQDDPDISTWDGVKNVLCDIFTTKHDINHIYGD